MRSFRRLALVLAVALPASPALLAQSSSSNPDSPAPQQSATAAQSDGATSVQARIRARREQRRAAAIHEAYDHLYEGYFGMAYNRFIPGKNLQRDHEYAWDAGLTRNFSERLGVTAEARGYYGTAYVYNNVVTNSHITNASVSQYAFFLGPSYRFYAQPRFSVSVRAMAGGAYGNFTGDTSGSETLAEALGLWPNSFAAAGSVAVLGEYNLTPRVGLRIAPEYLPTFFDSKVQNGKAFNVGILYRFGKQ